MSTWLRFLPDRMGFPSERAYVCWTTPGHEGTVEVVHPNIGAALAFALERYPDGFVSVEWDIAYDGCDLLAMEAAIAADPGRVQQAPYLIWPQASWRDTLGYERSDVVSEQQPPVLWAGRIDEPGGFRLPEEGRDAATSAFSLGCTYLPGDVLRAADAAGVLRALTFPMADTELSTWCAAQGWMAGIVWRCRPKHLHFDWPASVVAAQRAGWLR